MHARFSNLSGRFLRRAVQKLIFLLPLAMLLLPATPSRAAEQRDILSRAAPVYPVLAKRMKISGTVVVEATVNADGKVTEVKAINGNHALGPAAEDAVRQYKFAPGSGTSTVQVEIHFVLSD